MTRSPGGYRLYDAAAVERLELVSTLRQSGLDLATVRSVLEHRITLAEVAETHVRALDAQIAALRLSRAVLSTVAMRGTTTQEMASMHKLAALAARERQQIIDSFVDRVFAGVLSSAVTEQSAPPSVSERDRSPSSLAPSDDPPPIDPANQPSSGSVVVGGEPRIVVPSAVRIPTAVKQRPGSVSDGLER